MAEIESHSVTVKSLPSSATLSPPGSTGARKLELNVHKNHNGHENGSDSRNIISQPFTYSDHKSSASIGFTEHNREFLANTSYLLDTLLSEANYDKKIRPYFGGKYNYNYAISYE